MHDTHILGTDMPPVLRATQDILTDGVFINGKPWPAPADAATRH